MITDVRNVEVYENGSLANEDYHKMEGISSSGLHYLNEFCPAKFKYGEREETAALHFGIASHAAILEPDLFRANFVRDLSVSDDEEYITNAKDAMSAMRKDGVIVNKAQAKEQMKLHGALVTASDIKAALTAAGVKVKAGTKSDELAMMAVERLDNPIIFNSELELSELADEIVKLVPGARVYCGDDSADQVFKGCKELCPSLKVFSNDVADWHKKHEGKTMVKAEDYDIIERMRKTIFETEFIANVLKDAFVETSIICEIKVEGYDEWIKVKVRPDLITKNCLVPDYKTTRDVRPEQFEKLAFNGGYWFRQVFVCDVLSAVYKRQFHPALIAQEKDAPFISLLYVMRNTEQRDLLGENREAYTSALIEYNECKRKDVWPSYSDGPIDLKYPFYA